jgi:hypothetical protein
MRFIKKFKALFNQDKVKQEKDNKSNTQDRIVAKSRSKSLNNPDIKNYGKIENELLCDESFGELKVYRRAIIREKKEREKLHNQIYKELDKLG